MKISKMVSQIAASLGATFLLSGFGFINVEKGPTIGADVVQAIQIGTPISEVNNALGRAGALIAVEGEKDQEQMVYLWESDSESLRITTRFDRVVGKLYRRGKVRIASDAKDLSDEARQAASLRGIQQGIPVAEGERKRNDAMANRAVGFRKFAR